MPLCRKNLLFKIKAPLKKPPVLHGHILMYCACSFLHSEGSVCLANMGGSCRLCLKYQRFTTLGCVQYLDYNFKFMAKTRSFQSTKICYQLSKV